MGAFRSIFFLTTVAVAFTSITEKRLRVIGVREHHREKYHFVGEQKKLRPTSFVKMFQKDDFNLSFRKKLNEAHCCNELKM